MFHVLFLFVKFEFSSAAVKENTVSWLGSLVRRAGQGERRRHEPFG